MNSKEKERVQQGGVLLIFLTVPLNYLITLVKTRSLKAAWNNPKVREASLPFSSSKVCISSSVPATSPPSSATKDKCVLGQPSNQQHWLLRLHPPCNDSVENDGLHGESSSIHFFFLGAFERFIAKLHLSSRELTRLVLIKDYILDLKTQSLMAWRCKTPWVLLLTKILFAVSAVSKWKAPAFCSVPCWEENCQHMKWRRLVGKTLFILL